MTRRKTEIRYILVGTVCTFASSSFTLLVFNFVKEGGLKKFRRRPSGLYGNRGIHLRYVRDSGEVVAIVNWRWYKNWTRFSKGSHDYTQCLEQAARENYMHMNRVTEKKPQQLVALIHQLVTFPVHLNRVVQDFLVQSLRTHVHGSGNIAANSFSVSEKLYPRPDSSKNRKRLSLFTWIDIPRNLGTFSKG